MPDMSAKKTPMRERDPAERARSFDEVALGYTPEEARREAGRCLQCKNAPCVGGCPVQVDIPAFIRQLAEGDDRAAYDIIRRSNSLPAVCGRVCPQETQCERLCVRGRKAEPVGIGRLERYAADRALASPADAAVPSVPASARRVAVIGSGPAGLTCAGELAQRGYGVTVFEAFHKPGGVLVYGIPEFRLPKAIVAGEIDSLRALGVEIRANTVVGRSYTLEELFEEGFGAVFIGTGAGLPQFMDIPGESLVGVCSANELLTRINLMKAYQAGADTPVPDLRRTAVVGGGNVAMDAARCALRMGAEEVSIIYRRGAEEMPARAEEIHHAREEGIRFRLLCSPVEILGDEQGRVRGVTCVEMELGAPDESGRRRPVQKEGSEFFLEATCVVMAIGTSPNPLLRQTTPGLETDRRGRIIVRDEATGKTSMPGVYAGGDAVTGAATVILAMGAGRAAAQGIDAYLRSL